MSTELLMCVLKRNGKPATAAELHESAEAIAKQEQWPRSAITSFSVQKAAALLRHLSSQSRVTQDGTVKDNGNERPLWASLEGYDPRAPIPPPPQAPDSRRARLALLSDEQRYAVFEILIAQLAVYERHSSEIATLAARQERERFRSFENTRRALLDSGMGNLYNDLINNSEEKTT